jgi:hypothetical protein
MNGRNLADQMEQHVAELMAQGWTRHDAENEAYDLFIGADERHPERYETEKEVSDD